MSNIQGLVSIKFTDSQTGKAVPYSKAVKYGWIAPFRQIPVKRDEWGVEKDDVVLGHNLFVAQGRQALAFLLGNQAPLSNYTLASFSVGTGTIAPMSTDVALGNPITLSNGTTVKAIDGCDWPRPFVTRVSFTLGVNDANGNLITEMGLFTGNGTMIARKVSTGISKDSTFCPSFLWNVRL